MISTPPSKCFTIYFCQGFITKIDILSLGDIGSNWLISDTQYKRINVGVNDVIKVNKIAGNKGEKTTTYLYQM